MAHGEINNILLWKSMVAYRSEAAKHNTHGTTSIYVCMQPSWCIWGDYQTKDYDDLGSKVMWDK